ncbi:hypothetical protein CXF64_19895 [Pseudoalteromonas sp. GutCa3]|nr:hypothetical protein CXF64_19895 [Pseudoalteromonas sp. GutCa3]
MGLSLDGFEVKSSNNTVFILHSTLSYPVLELNDLEPLQESEILNFIDDRKKTGAYELPSTRR